MNQLTENHRNPSTHQVEPMSPFIKNLKKQKLNTQWTQKTTWLGYF